MNTQTYPLSGLHCQACVRRVSEALAPLAAQVQVSLQPMQVSLTDASADVAQLQAAVQSAGKYELLSNAISEQKVPLAGKDTARNAMDSIAKNNQEDASWLRTYYPLLLIVAFILGGSLLVQLGQHAGHGMGLAAISADETMRYFMAGFFLVFAFFKLLDLPAFANAYAGYDLLAARWHGWGYVYPFVELALGIAYLTHWNPTLTHWATILIMGFSAIGVIRAVMSKSNIQCACLGTVFKLPMSTVTIVEDVGMVLMAAWMLAAQF